MVFGLPPCSTPGAADIIRNGSTITRYHHTSIRICSGTPMWHFWQNRECPWKPSHEDWAMMEHRQRNVFTIMSLKNRSRRTKKRWHPSGSCDIIIVSAHRRGDIHNLILTGHGIAVAGLFICPTFAPRSPTSPLFCGNVFILVQFYARREEKSDEVRNSPKPSENSGFLSVFVRPQKSWSKVDLKNFCPRSAP